MRADEAYTQRMTVEGRSLKERQRERELCPEFWKELTKGSLATHRQTQHGVAKGGLESEGGGADRGDGGDRGDDPITYSMAFPVRAGPRRFPVKGCSGRAATRTAMRVHFWNWHVRDTVLILEEGKPPHPRFPPSVT